MRLFKFLVVLILAAVIGLIGYAYLGDMDPVRREVRIPVAGLQTGPGADPGAGESTGTDTGTGQDAGD